MVWPHAEGNVACTHELKGLLAQYCLGNISSSLAYFPRTKCFIRKDSSHRMKMSLWCGVATTATVVAFLPGLACMCVCIACAL